MIFVQLDCDYESDARLVGVSLEAETLYVRGLAFAKRTLTDGHISDGQLDFISRKIKKPQVHAQQLVDTGAWARTERGYQITAWSKRNLSAAEVNDRRTTRSAKANHARWHTGPAGTPSANCPLCPNDPTRTPNDLLIPNAKDSTSLSIELPIDRAIDRAIDRESSSRVQEDDTQSATTTLDQRVADAIELHARTSAEGKERPGAYAATVRNNTMIEHGTSLAAYCIEHPDSGSLEIVQAVITGEVSRESKPAWYVDPNCGQCGGDPDGLVNLAVEGAPATYGPCPCRRAEAYPEALATVIEFKQATA